MERFRIQNAQSHYNRVFVNPLNPVQILLQRASSTSLEVWDTQDLSGEVTNAGFDCGSFFTLQLPRTTVLDSAPSPNWKQLAVVCQNNKLYIYQGMQFGELVCSIQREQPLRQVRWLSDKLLVTLDAQVELVLWSLSESQDDSGTRSMLTVLSTLQLQEVIGSPRTAPFYWDHRPVFNQLVVDSTGHFVVLSYSGQDDEEDRQDRHGLYVIHVRQPDQKRSDPARFDYITPFNTQSPIVSLVCDPNPPRSPSAQSNSGPAYLQFFSVHTRPVQIFKIMAPPIIPFEQLEYQPVAPVVEAAVPVEDEKEVVEQPEEQKKKIVPTPPPVKRIQERTPTKVVIPALSDSESDESAQEQPAAQEQPSAALTVGEAEVNATAAVPPAAEESEANAEPEKQADTEAEETKVSSEKEVKIPNVESQPDILSESVTEPKDEDEPAPENVAAPDVLKEEPNQEEEKTKESVQGEQPVVQQPIETPNVVAETSPPAPDPMRFFKKKSPAVVPIEQSKVASSEPVQAKEESENTGMGEKVSDETAAVVKPEIVASAILNADNKAKLAVTTVPEAAPVAFQFNFTNQTPAGGKILFTFHMNNSVAEYLDIFDLNVSLLVTF